MKCYDELKAEMEKTQYQMVKAKQNETFNEITERKRLCNEFAFNASILILTLDEVEREVVLLNNN